MLDLSTATDASVRSAVDALAGSTLSHVSYYGFSYYGPDWDEGRYHHAAMGVELQTTGGQTFTACWGDAFGHFGLELIEAPAGAIFANEPEQRDFSRHHWWRPFMASSLHAALLWRSGYFDSGLPAPVALMMSMANARLWVAAAIQFDGASHMARGGFLLAMDHVLVTADETFAASIGLVA